MASRENGKNGPDEPLSILNVILMPLHVAMDFVDELVDNDPLLGSDQQVGTLVIRWLTLPFRLFAGFLLFIVQAWTSTRSGFAFIRALPAMLILGGFFTALLLADFVNTESRMLGANHGYYNYQLREYPEHPEYAVVFAEKLVGIKPDDDALKYQLAVAKEAAGEMDAALNVMTSIAPEDSAGYDMAHIWMSGYYLRSQTLGLNEAMKDELVSKHLQFAVLADPENKSANRQLAAIYVGKSNNSDIGSTEYISNRRIAIKYYEALLDGGIKDLYQVMAIPTLIELQMEVGDVELAKNSSLKNINQLRSLAEQQPETVALWYAMIRCSLILKDYGRAEKIAQSGISMTKQERSKRAIYEFASMIGEQMADDFTDMSVERQYAMRLRALCKSVTYNPFNRPLYNKLLEFVVAEARGKNPGQKVEISWPPEVNELWLRNGAVGVDTAGVVHGMLGIFEITNGNIVEGEKHWRLAAGLLPRVERVIDMLIRVAVEDHPEQVKNSFEMINLAIELFPEVPSFYHTRGIYYEKRGRFEEAIADFNYVAEKLPDDILLHKFLIRCHQQLGNDDKVIDQQVKLEQKLAEMGKAQRKRMESTLERFDRR